MSSICAAPKTRVSAINQHFFEEMTVIRLLRRRVNQTGIRRGILRLELADTFEVSRVGDNCRKLLDLFELVQLRVTCFFIGNGTAHCFPLVSFQPYIELRFPPHRQ
jgi:hypothetical protein